MPAESIDRRPEQRRGTCFRFWGAGGSVERRILDLDFQGASGWQAPWNVSFLLPTRFAALWKALGGGP